MTPCAGMHELFDSTDERDHQAARAYCTACPMLNECARLLEDVRASAGRYGQPEGTWAGELLIDREHHYTGDTAPSIVRMMRTEDEDARYSKFDAARAHREYLNGMRSEWINTGERVWQRAKKRRQRAKGSAA